MYFYGIDWTYIVLVLPAIVLSLIASANVNRTFERYSKIPNTRGLTGSEAARRILDANGLKNVRIERVPGNLTDHYDPSSNVVRLSDSTYSSSSAAAVGVAAHECGHAVQHNQGYLPIKIRSAIIPLTNIGSRLSIPLVILGIILTAWSYNAIVVAYIGVALFSLCVLFQLVTLPTEFNASRRAMATIRSMNLLDESDCVSCRKVLTAAALTYVAALAVSVMQLLRLILLVSDRRRR